MNYQTITTRLFTKKTFRHGLKVVLPAVVFALLAVGNVAAQTTTFTYQGRLTDGGSAANGSYEMQFKLFDSPNVGSGNQIGSAITNGAVAVNGGVFTVQLDYGAAAFPGADRFLEIGVRPAGSSDPYTVLSPRQQLTSTPYAIRAGAATTADTATNAASAANATQLGGVAANQFVQTNDSRLSDPRPPIPGSSAYIQNTSSQQSGNFNISGNGTAGGTLSANAVNAATQYNIAGFRALFAGTSTTIVGLGAGPSGSPGSSNAFFGSGAGQMNNNGASSNSFFGANSGHNNTTGVANSFFGAGAGLETTTGRDNTFVGDVAGVTNKDGSKNSFFGTLAGSTQTTGNRNTLIGYRAYTLQDNLSNATAIGSDAAVGQDNSLVLGSISGVNAATSDTSVGIGTTAPKARLHIGVNGGNILLGDAGCVAGYAGIGFGNSFSGCGNYSILGNGTDTIINRPTGGAIYFRQNNVSEMSINPGGTIGIATLGSGGNTPLCRNPQSQISTCSSSLRYKTNIQTFIGGLSVLKGLRPITFDWRQGGMHDLGFGAEDIAAVEPLLVTRNDKGEVEGVKYDRITAVLVNAVKEQQEQIKRQQAEIESLKQLVCRNRHNVSTCK